MKGICPKLINNIPEVEYNKVLKILSRYNLDPGNISKIQNMYIIKSSQGTKCLKPFKTGDEDIKRYLYITHYLQKKGFSNIAGLVLTMDNDLFVKYEGLSYYMTDFIEGRECNFDNFIELKTCVELLAKFHVYASGREGRRYFRARNALKNWPSVFTRRCSDLMQFKRVIESKKIKSEFDLEYKNNIECFYRLGLLSLELLKKSDYNSYLKMAKEEHCVCINNFYQQNTQIDNYNNIFFINLENSVIDIRAHNLGKLFRKVMLKEEYYWNFDILRTLVESYSSVLSISKEDLKLLLSILIFPHKFWKIGRKRYIKHKLWSEDKYLKKLNKQVINLFRQQMFILNFVEFYSLDIDLCNFILPNKI